MLLDSENRMEFRGSGIKVYNTGAVCIRNLEVCGDWCTDRQTGNDGTGVELFVDLKQRVRLCDVRVDNVEAWGFKNAGISVGSYPRDKSKSGYKRVSITNCVSHDNGDVGIHSYGYFGHNR